MSVYVCVQSLWWCPTLFKPIDCSLSGSSIHAILQARILEWVAISLLQGIFPTQESNLGLLHCREMVYQLSYEGSPIAFSFLADGIWFRCCLPLGGLDSRQCFLSAIAFFCQPTLPVEVKGELDLDIGAWLKDDCLGGQLGTSKLTA